MGDADGVDLVAAEVRKTKETAERIANGDSPKSGADDIRVLAGLVHQTAEQVERLAELVRTGTPQAKGHSSAEDVAGEGSRAQAE